MPTDPSSHATPDPERHAPSAEGDLTFSNPDANPLLHQERGHYQLLQAILDTIPHGVFWKDCHSVFLGCNQNFSREIGFASPELIAGMTDYDLPWTREEADVFRKHDQEVLRTGKPLLNHEEELPLPDGTRITLLTSKVPLYNAQGVPIGLIGIYNNISDRKQAELALRESEDRFRTLVEQANDAFFVYDLEGKVLDVNQSACDSLGYTRNELLNSSMTNVGLLFTPEGLAEQYQRARASQRISFMGIHRRKQGSTFPVETRVSAIEYGGKPALLALARDVTERMAAEEALRESERRYRLVVENASEIIYTTNAKGDYTYVNAAGLRASEYSAEELYALNYLDLALPEHRRRVRNVYRRQYMRRSPTSYVEFPFRSKSGRVIWLGQSASLIVEEGRITGFHLIARDITKRKHAEMNLLQANSLLTATLESTRDGIVVVDLEGRVQRTNQQFRELWQLPEETIEKRDERLLLEHAMAQVKDPEEFLRKVHALHADSETESYDVLELKDGRIFERYSKPQRVKERPAGRVWSFRDITRRVSGELERERLQSQMLHTQKLESLGVLAGGIAHDFNNLLTGILGSTEFAIDMLPADSPVRELLMQVERSSYRAADLTRQMLAYSGRGRFVVQPLRLSDVVRDISNLISASISKKCTLEFEFDDSECFVDADVSQIRQVVMNLLINASEAHCENPGRIVLSTGARRCTRQDFATTYLDEQLPEGHYCYLTVQDEGCGMTDEVKSRLFDPFFSTKFTGRGLGMSAVLGIVRGHCGAITVDSEAGKGSIITIYLPASAATAPVEAEHPAPRREAEFSKSATVLVVDDEPAVCRVATRLLERAGYTVLSATNGVDAVELVKGNLGEIHAVLLDMTMPLMGGKEALRALRTLKPELGVVLSSGYNEEEMLQGLQQDRLFFIQKPYRGEVLLDTMREALRASRAD